MSTIPRPLQYQVLVGCAWIDASPEHVRRGDTFRLVRQDGSVYLAAAGALPDVDDCGIYTAERDGCKDGVPFEVVQAVTLLVAPVVDLGGD